VRSSGWIEVRSSCHTQGEGGVEELGARGGFSRAKQQRSSLKERSRREDASRGLMLRGPLNSNLPRRSRPGNGPEWSNQIALHVPAVEPRDHVVALIGPCELTCIAWRRLAPRSQCCVLHKRRTEQPAVGQTHREIGRAPARGTWWWQRAISQRRNAIKKSRWFQESQARNAAAWQPRSASASACPRMHSLHRTTQPFMHLAVRHANCTDFDYRLLVLTKKNFGILRWRDSTSTRQSPQLPAFLKLRSRASRVTNGGNKT
jgi:hypothetical protein